MAGAEARPLAGGDEAADLAASQRDTVGTAIELSSRDAFRLGIGIGGALMILGGVISGIWVQNPRRRGPEREVPRAVAAGECARCEQGVPHVHEPEPAEVPA